MKLQCTKPFIKVQNSGERSSLHKMHFTNATLRKTTTGGLELSGKELSGKRWNYPENVGIIRKFFWPPTITRKKFTVRKKVSSRDLTCFNYFLDFQENKPMLELYGKHWIYPERVGIIRKKNSPRFSG